MEFEATSPVQARQPSQPRRIASFLLRHERLLDESLGLLILGAVVKAFGLANGDFPVATLTSIGLVALLVVGQELIARRTGSLGPLPVRTLASITAIVCAVLVVPWSVQVCWLLAIGAGIAGLSPKLVRWFGLDRLGRGAAPGEVTHGSGWASTALIDHLALVLRLAGVALLAVAVFFALQGIFGG